jgi:ADP-ribose pyrophosphatase YjhB (NUDIX family)
MKRIELRVAGLLARDGRVLLVNHVKHRRSYWVLPGGHVEKGESLAEAVVREMDEELALAVRVGPLVLIHDFITEARHVVNHVFLVSCADAAMKLTPSKTLKDARWVSLEELDAIDLLPPIAGQVRSIVANPPGETVYLGRM